MKRITRIAFLIFAMGCSLQAVDMPITPLKPAGLLESLDLNHPGLERVKKAADAGNRDAALSELLAYYRGRKSVVFETETPAPVSDQTLRDADAALRHVFNLGMGYPPQNYGPVVDWDSNPVHDIEWLAGMQRFYWQHSLVAAYRRTHNEKYAREWMALTADWIQKHVVDPPAFDWLDIQVGIRASNMCAAFDVMRHSPSLTPSFLALFLASVHDHAEKSFLYPRMSAHNKAILEDMGLTRVAIMFPEFQQSGKWLQRSYEVYEHTLTAQINSEGVQREWTPSYHTVVASQMALILDLCVRNGKTPPPHLLELTEKAFDYWLAITAPDHYLPMFGDTVRDSGHRPDFSVGTVAAALFHRPEFALLAAPDFRSAPRFTSRAFPEAGMFFFRSGWKLGDTYIALHNVPPPLSGHDQPDNGTFALYAFGKWLMPDSGSYAYEDTPHAGERDWFRQTSVHQTLTLDGQNSVNAPKTLLTKLAGENGVVTFENASYPTLTHRRTAFFLAGRYLVLVDEALPANGAASMKGSLDLHFQFAPGPFELDADGHFARTRFPQGPNVQVWQSGDAPVDVEAEKGQVSYKFNEKEPRPAIRFRARDAAPFVFLTVVTPYEGLKSPSVSAAFTNPFRPGQPDLTLDVSIGGRHWKIGRNLDTGEASLGPESPGPIAQKASPISAHE